MRAKTLIQLFVPPIYYKVKKRLFPKQQAEPRPLPKINVTDDRLVIIGNGPSLNKSIELYGDILQHTDCLMVNHSASTDLFAVIRPSFYLLVDSAWVYPDKCAHPDAIRTTIDDIVRKTTWQMYIFMPRMADGGYAVRRFEENTYIQVLFYEDGNRLLSGRSLQWRTELCRQNFDHIVHL